MVDSCSLPPGFKVGNGDEGGSGGEEGGDECGIVMKVVVMMNVG